MRTGAGAGVQPALQGRRQRHDQVVREDDFPLPAQPRAPAHALPLPLSCVSLCLRACSRSLSVFLVSRRLLLLFPLLLAMRGLSARVRTDGVGETSGGTRWGERAWRASSSCSRR
eukprot:3873599-Rhodomonas_salina.1